MASILTIPLVFNTPFDRINFPIFTSELSKITFSFIKERVYRDENGKPLPLEKRVSINKPTHFFLLIPQDQSLQIRIEINLSARKSSAPFVLYSKMPWTVFNTIYAFVVQDSGVNALTRQGFIESGFRFPENYKTINMIQELNSLDQDDPAILPNPEEDAAMKAKVAKFLRNNPFTPPAISPLTPLDPEDEEEQAAHPAAAASAGDPNKTTLPLLSPAKVTAESAAPRPETNLTLPPI